MTIAIVSALPPSVPSAASLSAMSAAEDMEGTDLVQDFASLLLGQLAAVSDLPKNFSSNAALEPARGLMIRPEEDRDDVPGDPLALLAVLTQAPIEPRAQVDVRQETDADTDTDTHADTDASPRVDVDIDAGAHASLYLNAGTNTGIDAGTNTRTDAGARTDADTDARIDAGPRASIDVHVDTGADRREPLPASARATPQDTPPLADRTAAASGTAKFAASLEAFSGKEAAAQESVKTPAAAMTTAIAPDVQASRAGEPMTLAVPTPIHDRQWSGDFAQKVTWIATQRNQSAELTLNPPTLGNIEVSIKIDSHASTAVATFVSGSAEVRETIETALPRLREMLAGVGIELGDAQVSAESFRQPAANYGQNGQDGQRRGEAAHASAGEDSTLPAVEGSAEMPRSAAILTGAGHGLVDMFA